MTELEASGGGDHPPPYMIFVVVFLFFLTGLLGFLVCHLLKKKGYRCRTGEIEDEEEQEKLGGIPDDDHEENQDTVEQILRCIIENEANMEAFNEMIGNQNVCVRHDPRLRKESIGGVPPHHHTVHSGTGHNSCHLCAQVQSKRGRRQSRTPRFKQRPGEQTVFSVGRFRVTHTDKKLHGGPNALVSSGDQLNHTQDSEERKEDGYNLRSMFKDVRPPSEGTSSEAPNVGKRRKSLTIFALRRGSDPVAVQAGDGTGRETGGFKFALKQQPAVLEELLNTDNKESPSERGVEPASGPLKKQMPGSPQHMAKTSPSIDCPSSLSKNPECDTGTAPEDGSKHEPFPKTGFKTGKTALSPPNSLSVIASALSEQTCRTRDVEDRMLKNEGGYDPRPLQTSTTVAPLHESFVSDENLDTHSSITYPVTQTPPDQSSSPEHHMGFGANLALISLGSSPPSSYQIGTPSSVSSLKTPTSTLVITMSSKLSPNNITLEETPKTDPALTPSPKVSAGLEMSSQSAIPLSSYGISIEPFQVRTPLPGFMTGPKIDTVSFSPQTPSSPAEQSFEGLPCLTLESGSIASVRSFNKGDIVSSRISLNEPAVEGATIPGKEQKTELKRAGILKTAKSTPFKTYSKGSTQSDQLSEVGPRNFLLSPPSPVSSSSPMLSRSHDVTIVKASPESKTEFSLITIVEKEESPSSTKDREGGASDLEAESEKMLISPAVDQKTDVSVSGIGQPERQSGETSNAQEQSTVSQEKDDEVEMEDIRYCKVTQEDKVPSASRRC